MERRRRPRPPEERVDWRASAPFIACHLVPLAGFATGVPAKAIVLGVVLYGIRIFFITAGYHRYFAHRTYRVARVPQFVLAFGGTLAVQKGPLWWAAAHRDHHRYADTDRDPHSPQKGFWWSHAGWVLSRTSKSVDYDSISDFARYPELRFLDRHDWIGPWMLAVTSFLIAGWSGLVIGFFASTVVLWHATFLVNSWAHVWGRRRYATADTSRNSVLVAALTLGEGWHNNHHHYPASARHGHRWWQLDVGYAVLKAGSWLGLVRDLREPPERVKQARRLRHGHLDLGSLRLHLNRAMATLSRVRWSRSVGPERDQLDEELARELAELERLEQALADVADRASRIVAAHRLSDRVGSSSPPA